MRTFFFFLLLFLVSVRYAFTGRNSRILPIRPVWSVFFWVRNKGGIYIGLLVNIVYTGQYGTELTSLVQISFTHTNENVVW